MEHQRDTEASVRELLPERSEPSPFTDRLPLDVKHKFWSVLHDLERGRCKSLKTLVNLLTTASDEDFPQLCEAIRGAEGVERLCDMLAPRTVSEDMLVDALLLLGNLVCVCA